jgi:hypothetical protein
LFCYATVCPANGGHTGLSSGIRNLHLSHHCAGKRHIRSGTIKQSTEELPPLPLSDRKGPTGRNRSSDFPKRSDKACLQKVDIAIQDTNEELNQQKIMQQYGSMTVIDASAA